MQQFPAYATIFKLSYWKFFSEDCLCNNFLTFIEEFFSEACLCNNFKFMQHFFNFHVRNFF